MAGDIDMDARARAVLAGGDCRECGARLPGHEDSCSRHREQPTDEDADYPRLDPPATITISNAEGGEQPATEHPSGHADETSSVASAKMEPAAPAPAGETSMLPIGARVRTTADAGDIDWNPNMRHPQRGAVGRVFARSRSHGICYAIVHNDGSWSWYGANEVEEESDQAADHHEARGAGREAMTDDALVDLARAGAPDNPIVRPSAVVAIVANQRHGTVVLHLRAHEHNPVLVVRPDDDMVARVHDLRRRATELRETVKRLLTGAPPLDEDAIRADERARCRRAVAILGCYQGVDIDTVNRALLAIDDLDTSPQGAGTETNTP